MPVLLVPIEVERDAAGPPREAVEVRHGAAAPEGVQGPHLEPPDGRNLHRYERREDPQAARDHRGRGVLPEEALLV